ncbi:adaptin ear-binding coat-associated protein 1 NECAP-1 [Atractiella rhizophila]|nr:adaptin ear-binding coat-associated protein 1 NECAP-1 [Atractiella rhizophila]
MEDDTYESVLFVARETYVYRLPPRTSTAGYKAAEWGDLNAFLWSGRLRILEKSTLSASSSPTLTIQLEEATSGDVFAQCPYDEKNWEAQVEPVLDSSRYFILKIVDKDTGKHAFIGMGFAERGEAFDFNVVLQDWRKRVSLPPTDEASSSSLPAAPSRDFSLKEGQTITVSIGGKGGKKRERPPPASTTGGGLLPLLPPPPSAPKRG